MIREIRPLPGSSTGFTLLEITVAVAVASIIAAAAIRTLPDQIRRAKSDATIAQVMLLGEAAQAYEFTEGEWPDEANNCADAFATLTTATPGAAVVPGVTYVEGLDIVSPWGTDYEFTCVPGDRQFRLTVASTDEFSGYIANGVPAATVTDDETTSLFPRAEFIPNLTQVLYRDDSGGVERNTMRTDLFMADTNDIIMGGGDLTGAQRIQAAQYGNLAGDDLIINDTFVGDGGVNTDGFVITRSQVLSSDGLGVPSGIAANPIRTVIDGSANVFAENARVEQELNVINGGFSVGPLGAGVPNFTVTNVGDATALSLNTTGGDVISAAAVQAGTEYRLGTDAIVNAAATFIGAGGVDTEGNIQTTAAMAAEGAVSGGAGVFATSPDGTETFADLRSSVQDFGFVEIGKDEGGTSHGGSWAAVLQPDCPNNFNPEVTFWPVSFSNDGVTDPIGAINMPLAVDVRPGGGAALEWRIGIELATAGSTTGSPLSAGFNHFIGYATKCSPS